MIAHINRFLSPLENWIEKYRKILWWTLIFLAFLSLGALFSPQTVHFTGEQSLNLLWIILWLPIFARVFAIGIAIQLMPLRKELWILMGTLAFVHGGAYIIAYPTTLTSSYFWWNSTTIAYTAFWFFALLWTLPLLLTSSNFAIKKLGKKWKTLHKLVYLVLILTLLHVIILKGGLQREYAGAILFLFYTAGKILEWKNVSLTPKKIYPKWQKWLCIPCGYIYDPEIGDEDSGILPGTEFSDIADNWSCPVCGVTKRDFVPYDESHDEKLIDAKVIEKTFLNPTTLELQIETSTDISSKPWQFASFVWQDEKGKFWRSYSLAKKEGNRLSFLIKLKEHGRWAVLLKDLKVGESVSLRGIFGNFLLQDTEYPKIFIATGTGLAPVYHMLTTLQSSTQLYFSVAKRDDLFYVDEIRSLKHVESHIHLTREAGEGFSHGRIDVRSIEATNDTEWYLCGNPSLIKESKHILQHRGFTKIYTEEF